MLGTWSQQWERNQDSCYTAERKGGTRRGNLSAAVIWSWPPGTLGNEGVSCPLRNEWALCRLREWAERKGRTRSVQVENTAACTEGPEQRACVCEVWEARNVGRRDQGTARSACAGSVSHAEDSVLSCPESDSRLNWAPRNSDAEPWLPNT